MSYIKFLLWQPNFSPEWNYIHFGVKLVVNIIFIFLIPILNNPDVRRLVAASLLPDDTLKKIFMIPIDLELQHSLLLLLWFDLVFSSLLNYFHLYCNMNVPWKICLFYSCPWEFHAFIFWFCFKVNIKTGFRTFFRSVSTLSHSSINFG